MYSLEVKEQALLLLKEYSIKEVATKIGVSIPTLYNWKKEYEKKVSKSISQMIVDLEYDKAIEVAKLFPKNKVIQSQLITVYIKQGEYEKVIEIAKRFPNRESIQSQLITIYIKQGEYETGIETAELFFNYDPDSEVIQSQLITIYIKQGEYEKAIEIAKRFPKNEIIQLDYIYKRVKYLKNNLNINPIEDETIVKKINQIRSKILLGTVQLEDVEYLDSFKDEIDLERYLLIKAAIYERLNFKNNCVAIIKQIPNIDIRQKRKLIEEVLKKQKYYNIQKWDELIKWKIDDMESYLENKNQIVEIEQKRTRKLVLPVEKSTEKQNHSEKTKIISGTMTRSNSKNNKNVKPKKEKETTIYECLNSDYKLAVSELKLKYYLEMYDEHHKKDGILKYDRLETVLNSDSSNTLAFRQLLLMLMDASYDFSNDYPTEYQEIKNKVLTKTLSTKKG